MDISKDTESELRKLLKIPDNFKVLFMTGGATQQFSCVPMNLLGGENKKAVYAVNGTWGEKAAAEAKKYGEVVEAFDSKVLKQQNYIDIPDQSEWTIDESAAYLHYSDNETITGLEFN